MGQNAPRNKKLCCPPHIVPCNCGASFDYFVFYIHTPLYEPSRQYVHTLLSCPLALAIYLECLVRLRERREAEVFAPPSALNLPQCLVHGRQANQGSF